MVDELRREYCPGCGAEIGRIVAIDGDQRPYFDDGSDSGVLALVGRRWCPYCGKVYHWHGEGKTVSQIAPQQITT